MASRKGIFLRKVPRKKVGSRKASGEKFIPVLVALLLIAELPLYL